MVVKEGKDGDRFLSYVLFAYREVPQSSMVFSPWTVVSKCAKRTITCAEWDVGRKGKGKRSSESIVSHMTMRDRMDAMKELVRKNLEKAHVQKKWYN